MMCALIFDGDGLLHQPSFFELIAVDERSAKASLLVWCETLSKVGIHFVGRVCVACKHTVNQRTLEFVIRVVDMVSSLGDGGSCALFALPLGTTGWVQCSFLFVRLQRAHELTVYETIVHDSARRPVNSVSPAFDA